ncbi:hypothetical protein U9M48_018513 [Paspalum notatum var. saurae]|uniref:Uncharacterized protein n=1 Tax=Paspalum notatum var. saurae TaxID=547442 RepID=A0AAQ3T9K5_PASNO
MCASNSRRATATSLSRFTTTVVPSSSTALYDVPTLPLPSTSADARSRSSRSKLYPAAPFPTNTSRLCSPAAPPAAAAATAAADPDAPPPRSSLDDDVMPPPPPSPPAAGGWPLAAPAPAAADAEAAAVAALGPSRAPLRRRRRDAAQSTMARRRRSPATTAPTTMPAIAAPESLRFLPEEPGTGPPPPGLIPGAGVGGKKGQGGSGAPQSLWLPAKESAGKPESDLGMEPLRLLSETLKTPSPGMLMLGMGPERPLPSSRSTRSAVRLLSAKGIGPERLLSESTRRSRPARPSMPCGMAPDSRFCCRNSDLSPGSRSRSSGTGPRMRLERSESTRRLVRRPSVAGGMAPTRPTPGRRSSTTVVLALSHVTPTQVQAGVEAFHPSRRSCGVAVRNASSADRSLAGGSATARLARKAAAARRTRSARGPGIATSGRPAGAGELGIREAATGEALGILGRESGRERRDDERSLSWTAGAATESFSLSRSLAHSLALPPFFFFPLLRAGGRCLFAGVALPLGLSGREISGGREEKRGMCAWRGWEAVFMRAGAGAAGTDRQQGQCAGRGTARTVAAPVTAWCAALALLLLATRRAATSHDSVRAAADQGQTRPSTGEPGSQPRIDS